jgi:hypothetical protein
MRVTASMLYGIKVYFNHLMQFMLPKHVCTSVKRNVHTFHASYIFNTVISLIPATKQAFYIENELQSPRFIKPN